MDCFHVLVNCCFWKTKTGKLTLLIWLFAHWNIASSKQWFDHRINVSDVLDSDIYRKIYNLISFILTWYSRSMWRKTWMTFKWYKKFPPRILLHKRTNDIPERYRICTLFHIICIIICLTRWQYKQLNSFMISDYWFSITELLYRINFERGLNSNFQTKYKQILYVKRNK